MSRRLRRLGLEEHVVAALAVRKLQTAADVFGRTELELLETTGLARSEVAQIRDKAAAVLAGRSRTAWDLWIARQKAASKLPTTLPALDAALRGGLICGTITEVAGPCGCGKTQFCTMMSILAALPPELGGTGGAVLYIDTEGAFSAQRLLEMAQARFPDHFADAARLKALAAAVHIQHEQTCDSLMAFLKRLEEAVASLGVKLVILDSVASLVRKEFDGRSMRKRTELLTAEASILKHIAELFDIPVLVTNQVTTKYGGDMESEVLVALGNTWAHSVNTRLVFEYTTDAAWRRAIVVKSPLAPVMSCFYCIDAPGFVALEGDEPTEAHWSNVGVRQAEEIIAANLHASILAQQSA
eukprot:m.31727 g.31727  ORF g.31727 m.31727 type:complete len:356 (+) comp5396_c0_seq1:31-1098(+)